MRKVIVYNCSYNGLSIIQELSAKGIECIALDSKYSVGVFSKYSKFKKCPNPIKYEKLFIKYLITLCKEQKEKPILFPTNDEWALITAKYIEEIKEVAIPCVASFDVVQNLLSKEKFYHIGNQKGYMTPKTWSFDEIHLISEKDFPVAVKPKYKTPPSENYKKIVIKLLKKNRLIVINNKIDLISFYDEYSQFLDHFIIQEYIKGNSGDMFTIGIFADSNSEVKALFTGRKVRGYPADIGDNILGESYVLPDHIIKNTKRIVKEMGYFGIAEFEYKKDKLTDEYFLIEINPRAWSWIGITPYCGVNIPYMAYLSLNGEKIEYTESNVKNGEIKYVKLFQDFINCLIRYRFNYHPWHCSYKKWKKSISSNKLIIAEYNKRDWGIIFASIPYLIGKMIFQKWR